MEEKEIVKFYLEQDVLISPELLEGIIETDIPIKTEFSVLTKDSLTIATGRIPINISDFEQATVLKEKHHNTKMYSKFLEYIEIHKPKKISIKETSQPTSALQEPAANPIADPIKSEKTASAEFDKITAKIRDATNLQALAEQRKEFLKQHKVILVNNYAEKSRKRVLNDFVGHYNVRFKDMEKILRSRQELQNLTSIGKIIAKKEKENIALIGVVYEKSVTKNNNIMMTLEDPTGFVKVVVTKQKEELFALAQEIQLDEIIGVTGMFDNLVFANNLLLPDIPLTKELKKSPQEGYFVVIADTQVGNKLFLTKEFEKFLTWLNGEAGSEAQREIASQVKYLFIVGDLVDGVGTYPDQEYDLSIIDIRDQYAAFRKYLEMMPDIPIFVCPGNHDVGRLSEPQPGFQDEYSRAIWTLPNVIPVSNPSTINIYAQPGFGGFDVLLYHGYSFFYYFANVPSIRQKGGPKRPDLAMKYLLQRRHLAPSHTSTLYVPDPKKDPLLIDKVPDFFFSGHTHRSSVNNYKNVTCINASCWVSKSDEQERRGLEPQPARAFLINMQTREIKIMNFLSKEDQEAETIKDAQSI